MKNLNLLTAISLLVSLLLFNCNTPSKLLQDGDYDDAVYAAVKNLRQKKKKREKDIIVVEEAYRKITQRDMDEIVSLKAERQAVNWVKINQLHNNIKDRQDLISPYLPLISTKTYYKADFRFVKIIPLEIDSRNKAAAYYYAAGNTQLATAEKGDKTAARSANRKFQKVKNYFNDYKNNNALIARSYELGVDKVLLEMRNSTFAFIPQGFENELLTFNERGLNEYWTTYYRAHNAPTDIDYKVIIDLENIDVSPERIEEKFYTLEKKLFREVKVPVQKEVITAHTYPVDDPFVGTEEVNRAKRIIQPKDTKQVKAVNKTTQAKAVNLVNHRKSVSFVKAATRVNAVNQVNLVNQVIEPVKEIEYKTVYTTTYETVYETEKVPYFVYADVIDIYQRKSAFVSARVSFYEANSQALLRTDNVSAEIAFENIASTFIGDRRALTDEVKCRIGGRPVRFPSDGTMVMDAASELKGKIGQCIKRKDNYVLR